MNPRFPVNIPLMKKKAASVAMMAAMLLVGDMVYQAEAVIGRPLTPFSYAGVARRTARRAVAVLGMQYTAPDTGSVANKTQKRNQSVPASKTTAAVPKKAP